MEGLRQEFQRGRVVIVAGAGVSVAAAGMTGWRGLIDSAIAHLSTVGTVDEEQIDAVEARLQQARTPQDLVACAETVRDLLVGSSPHSGEFAAWLGDAVGNASHSLRDPSLLRAIHNLGASLITTTNYDKLLSSSQLGLESTTWREPQLLLHALRDGGRVVHLHGVWDDPDSVIFGASDYGALVVDDAHRSFLQTLWMDRTLLFIGCSFDGMRDPDFAALLDWVAETFPHATARHYAIVRDDAYNPEQTDRFLNQWRIQLLPYGASHADLVPFLQMLVPSSPALVPSPPPVFVGRQTLVDEIRAALVSRRTVLVYGMGGIGKSSAVARVIAIMRAENPDGNELWLDGSGKSLPDLCRDIGSIVDVPDFQFLSDSEILPRVAYALSRMTDVTVVIDGATDSAAVQALAHELASVNVGLVVTARARVSGFGQYIEVPPLDDLSADELFKEVSGVSTDEPLVRQICSLLEGHPLAIVLAASRHAVEDMPLERLLSRLSAEKHRLDTLRDPEQPETPSTSVRASLFVSMENLPAELEETLATLAHFDADTSLDLLSSALSLELAECEDWVGRLIARSLVQRHQRRLLHLHALTRSAVMERFGDQASTYQAMVELAIVSLLAELHQAPAQGGRQLLEDLDSVIAFIRSTTAADPEVRWNVVVRLVIFLCEPHGLLYRYGLENQYLVVAEDISAVAVALAENLGDMDLIAQALCCQANTVGNRRRHQDAIMFLRRAQRIVATSTEDRGLLATIKCAIGNNLLELNRYPEAESALRDALADAIASGEPGAIAPSMGQLGLVLLRSRKLDEAEMQYKAARHRYEEMNEPLGVAACAYSLAEIARHRGQDDLAWSLQTESLEAEIAADNLTGALSSLEHLASEVRNEDQLAWVLARTDSLVELLPTVTVWAQPGIADSLKSRAYISAGRYDLATDLLAVRLADCEHREDIHGQAVCLGRLSEVSVLEGDLASAYEYIEKSREAYAAAENPMGVVTCRISGVSIALELDDVASAINHACEGIQSAALLGDVERLVPIFMQLVLRVMPRLPEAPQILFPVEVLSFPRHMALITSVAQQRDLGRLVGAVNKLLENYGPGGIPAQVGG